MKNLTDLKIFFVSITLLVFSFSYSQVGIGTTSPVDGALLDVESTDKGVMIPRMDIIDLTTLAPVTKLATSPEPVGLLVFNTDATNTGANAGFYYWDGNDWIAIGGGSSSNDWAITGNNITSAGGGTTTSDGTNFVGTTSDENLNFRTNNIFRGRFGNLGEFFVGTQSTILPGDLMNAVGNTTFPFAVNGYTSFPGAGVYGLRDTGSTGAWGAGQFELANTVAASRGAYGLANTTSQYGVNGFKPAGGLGWGGLFQNDLGYTGFFGAASDRSLKKNITNFNNALGILVQLPIYSYQYKTETYDVLGDDSLHFGVMADELKTLLPSLVKSKTLASSSYRSKDKHYRGVNEAVDLVNYIELVPIAIQAIKEQQSIIDAQNDKIETLETKLLVLETKLNQLLESQE